MSQVSSEDEFVRNPIPLERKDSSFVFFGQNTSKICFASVKDALFTPLSVKFWNNPQFIRVLAASNHAAAIDSKGNLYQWGKEYFGEEVTQESQYDVTLTGKNLSQLDINSKLVAGMNRRGEIYLLDSKKALQQSKSYEQPPVKKSFLTRFFTRSNIRSESYRTPLSRVI